MSLALAKNATDELFLLTQLHYHINQIHQHSHSVLVLTYKAGIL